MKKQWRIWTKYMIYILEDLTENNTVIACDGSTKCGKNTFAVCVGNGRRDEVMKFAQEVPGWPISSDRAELG